MVQLGIMPERHSLLAALCCRVSGRLAWMETLPPLIISESRV